MKSVLANLLVLWVFCISPNLCVAGMLPGSCEESECCEACTECTPHSPDCANDPHHAVAVTAARDREESEPVAIEADHSFLLAIPLSTRAGITPIGPVGGSPYPEKEHSGPLGLPFIGPLLI